MLFELIAYTLILVVVAILAVLYFKNRQQLRAFNIKDWGPIAPLILSVATFFLAAQQASFSRKNFEKAIEEDRPRLALIPPLDGRCDPNTGLGELQFHLTNFGKAPGHLFRHRTIYELSDFKPRPHGVDHNVRFSSTPDVLRTGSANYDFQIGPLDLVPVLLLPKEACSSLLSGNLLRFTLDVDYSDLRQSDSHKFTYRYRTTVYRNINGQFITGNTLQQLDTKTSEYGDLIEIFKSMIGGQAVFQIKSLN